MDIDKCIESLAKGLLIDEKSATMVCRSAIDILAEEPQVLKITPPVTVCGDIHGQLYDLKMLFTTGGEIPSVKYLFLGDYVDRGYYSTETFLLLLSLKIKYSDMLYLIRGNHEMCEVTLRYGFYEECMRKYGSANIWQHCLKVFDFLSLSAVIGETIFCVHGGLSPHLFLLDNINDIKKGTSSTASDHTDLLWSDPSESNGWVKSPRGTGFLYGPDVINKFNQANNLDFICRAHQLCMSGYKWNSDCTVITVFSAPNYCYRCQNKAGIIEIDEQLSPNIKTFEAAPTKDRGAPYRVPSIFLGD